MPLVTPTSSVTPTAVSPPPTPAVIVVCAASGVQVGTELAWQMAERRGLPRAIFINRIDRENANFEETLQQVQAQLSRHCVPVQLPIGSQDTFQGVVGLISKKAYLGEKATEADAPADLAGQIETLRAQLMEAVAETDEELLDKYLEDGELSEDEIRKGLAAGMKSGDVVPVFVGSAARRPASRASTRRTTTSRRRPRRRSRSPKAARSAPTRTARSRPRSSRQPPTPTSASSPTCVSSPARSRQTRTPGTRTTARTSASASSSSSAARRRSRRSNWSAISAPSPSSPKR